MAEEYYKPPRSAEELLRRYAAGERDFRSSNLSDANLRHADVSSTDLTGANLSGANLSKANLTGVNFTEAGLRNADLSGADLSDANLSGTFLVDANLSNANLSGAHFGDANLSNANLTGAYLISANVSDANLTGADLTGADLSGADLTGVNFSGANLSGAVLGKTTLVDLDFSPLCDASPPVEHLSPSTVDHRAIVKSLSSPNLKDFLQRTGIPEVFVEFDVSCAQSLKMNVLKNVLRSTFIIYGDPDRFFAQKLYKALHKNGVITFFFPEHAIPGRKLYRAVQEGISSHQRVILICSKGSLDRKGVLHEIEETLLREARDGGEEYLIPIALDDYVFSKWSPPDAGTAQSIRGRVVADFAEADRDEAKFNAGLLRLIAALRK